MSKIGARKGRFVDRGDPTAQDFTISSLIGDGTWRDLNLSSIVPSGAKAVLLGVFIRGNTINDYVLFRRNGNVNTQAIGEIYQQVAGVYNAANIVVPLDPERIIEYYFGTGTWNMINIIVRGWWI